MLHFVTCCPTFLFLARLQFCCMGDVESDIAVIKNDIKHIKDGIEEIKNTCKSRDDDCECKFSELYAAKNSQSIEITEIKSQVSLHNKVIAGLGALFLVLVGIAGDLVTWLRGG